MLVLLAEYGPLRTNDERLPCVGELEDLRTEIEPKTSDDSWGRETELCRTGPPEGRLSRTANPTTHSSSEKLAENPRPRRLPRELRDERDRFGGQSLTVLPHKYVRSLLLGRTPSGKQ